jgi:DnaK suppressor protein
MERITMHAAQWESSKTTLVSLLNEMEQPVLREEIAVENPPDVIDRVQHAAQRELAVRRIDSHFNRLQSIKLALQRLDDGTYGTCMRCGETISNKRLTAIPWASYCLKCQEITDREGREQDEMASEWVL